METLIYVWLRLGYLVYWAGWFGSVAIWNVSGWAGIGIGVSCAIVHLIILQILFLINGDGWIWDF